MIRCIGTCLQYRRRHTTDITTHQWPLVRSPMEQVHTRRPPPSASDNKRTVDHREVTVISSITVTRLLPSTAVTIVLQYENYKNLYDMYIIVG